MIIKVTKTAYGKFPKLRWELSISTLSSSLHKKVRTNFLTNS